MRAARGAPTFPVQYITLFSSILLVVSAFICLFAPYVGRVLAVFTVLGIGTIYVPASAELVPRANVIISPIGYMLLLGYFALLGFALFSPTRWRCSIPLLACCLLASGAFATTTYLHRLRQGDMQWPLMVEFEWTPTTEPVRIDGNGGRWITPETKTTLSEHGITGVLRWSGSQGDSGQSRRVIIICHSRIPASKDLPYPKQGTLVYIFDGTAWRSIPEKPSVYPAHATLQTDGIVVQGPQGFAAFAWR